MITSQHGKPIRTDRVLFKNVFLKWKTYASGNQTFSNFFSYKVENIIGILCVGIVRNGAWEKIVSYNNFFLYLHHDILNCMSVLYDSNAHHLNNWYW